MSNTKPRIEYDLVLVGASSSNLTLAHTILGLAEKNPEFKFSIAILEKAHDFGGHIVSGAVVHPYIFTKAFPDHIKDGMPIEAICKKSCVSLMAYHEKWDIPSILTRAAAADFVKEGYYILTLSNVVAWMAENLKAKAAQVPNVKLDIFLGFPAMEIIYEGDKVAGLRVDRTGNDEDDIVYSKLVCFGDKGFLSKDLIKKYDLGSNPQIWSVGVKETWQLAEDSEDIEGKVWHTLGYPTLDGTLGGGFIYGLKNRRVSIGLVISLDSSNPNIHPQKQLQEYKKHPWLQKMLRGAELMHYGAAVLPEGGYASLPKKFQVNGALILGDALGLLDVKALAGVDKAIESGYIAAKVAYEALKANDFSEAKLSKYQSSLMASPYMDKFKENRYFRKAFIENPELLRDYLPEILSSIDQTKTPVLGGLKVGAANPFKATKAFLRSASLLNNAKEIKEEVVYKPGYQHIDPNFNKVLMDRCHGGDDFAKTTVYSREDAVFYANTRYDEHPSHIDEFNSDTCLTCIKTYEAKSLDVPCVSDCTAEVHRLDISSGNIKVHAMSLENCVQCRTCELICPEQNLRVNPAYAGSGPDFRGL